MRISCSKNEQNVTTKWIFDQVRSILTFYIRNIQQRLGVTTIYVTHDQEESLAISDNVIVMNKSIIAQEGKPIDLYDNPNNKFVANFIGDANIIKADDKQSINGNHKQKY